MPLQQSESLSPHNYAERGLDKTENLYYTLNMENEKQTIYPALVQRDPHLTCESTIRHCRDNCPLYKGCMWGGEGLDAGSWHIALILKEAPDEIEIVVDGQKVSFYPTSYAENGVMTRNPPALIIKKIA